MLWPFGNPQAKAQALFDSFEEWEVNTGQRSRTRGMYVTRLTDMQIADLMTNNWLARRIVRCLPEAAWGSELVFADAAALESWQAMNLSPNSDDGSFLTAAMHARAYGKCLLLKGYEYGGELSQPLTENGALLFLEPITPAQFEVQAADLCKDQNNPARFGLPEFYRVTHGRFAGNRIHYSRFVEFIGPTAPDAQHMRSEIKGVHMSVLDPVYSVICEYGTSWGAVSKLIKQASIPIFKMKGAIKGLSADAANVIGRFDLMAAQMDLGTAVVLDADSNEEYRREAVSFADLPAIIQQLSIKIASAGNIPLGELFGRMIAGLGDSEGGETAKWERQIDSYRVRTLAPRVRSILGGTSSVKWSFAPVTKPAPKDTQALLKGFWDMGAVTDAEVRLAAERDCNLEHVEEWIPQGDRAPAPEDTAPTDAPAGNVGANTAATLPGGTQIVLTPSTVADLATANQALASLGLPPATLPDGTPDPDGLLPANVYAAKKKADALALSEKQNPTPTNADPANTNPIA